MELIGPSYTYSSPLWYPFLGRGLAQVTGSLVLHRFIVSFPSLPKPLHPTLMLLGYLILHIGDTGAKVRCPKKGGYETSGSTAQDMHRNVLIRNPNLQGPNLTGREEWNILYREYIAIVFADSLLPSSKKSVAKVSGVVCGVVLSN